MGHQEVDNMKQEIRQLKMTGLGKTEVRKEEEEAVQLQGIQVALANLETKENQLKIG